MTTKEPAAILSALDMQIAIQALPCVHPGTVPQLQTAYEAGHRHALRQAGEFVVERLTATPAPVPGPILTWEQRVEADPNFIGVRSKEHLFKYVMDEVRDLRAALAAVPGQSEPMLCEFGNQDDFDEAHGDWERQRRYAVVGAQEYNGNTVSYMYSKAKNYGNALLECCKLLGGTGDVRDRIKALLAERDALMAPVSGATSDDSFVSTTLSELARRGASPAGLSLAAQLLGVGPCSVCGYRKLHCRCAAQPAPVSGATSDEHQTYRALAEENRTLTAKMNEYRDKLTESEEARHELVRLLNEEAGGKTFMGEPALPAISIKQAVNRFLGWTLPKTFGPDGGITFDGRKDDEWNKNKPWPIGTNLLTAVEAQAMFEYCLFAPAGAVAARPDLAKLKSLALAAEGVKFTTEGFEQTEGNGQFYGGLIMHENGHTIVAQCVLQPWADFIAAANPAAILSLIAVVEGEK